MAAVPKIAAFKALNIDNDNLWRVLMFGEVRLNFEKSTEPLIDVFAAPLRGSPAKPDQNRSTDYGMTKKVSVGVGQLPYVFTGSVWYDGEQQPYGAHTYETEKFKLEIEPSTTASILFGHSQRQGWRSVRLVGDVYKKSRHWSELSQCNCATVSYKGVEHKVIIPAAELIRFYFVQSTALAQALFTPDIHNLDTLCNLEKSKFGPGLDDEDNSLTDDEGEEAYVHKVHLRQRFYNVDGWIIARLLYSPHARRRAQQVHGSLMRASNEGRKTFPNTGFPFVGETNLRVSGRWLKDSNDAWRFLVYHILECSGPWPFDDLMVGRDNDGRSDGVEDPERPSAFSGSTTVKSKHDVTDGDIETSQDPANTLQAAEAQSGLFPSRFTPLRNKEIIRAPKEPVKYRSGGGKPNADEHPDYSTGKGTWGATDAQPFRLCRRGRRL